MTVIDFCLTRTLVCDEDTNYQSLRLSWASKTSCEQRKGKVLVFQPKQVIWRLHKEQLTVDIQTFDPHRLKAVWRKHENIYKSQRVSRGKKEPWRASRAQALHVLRHIASHYSE